MDNLDFLLSLVFGLAIISIQPSENLINRDLSIQSTNNLKGFSILIIVLHHLSQRTAFGLSKSAYWLSRFNVVGRLAVAIFFFVSGYGLTRQFQQKGQDYLHHFLRKRIVPIIATYSIFAVIIYTIEHFRIGLTLSIAQKSIYSWLTTCV